MRIVIPILALVTLILMTLHYDLRARQLERINGIDATGELEQQAMFQLAREAAADPSDDVDDEDDDSSDQLVALPVAQ